MRISTNAAKNSSESAVHTNVKNASASGNLQSSFSGAEVSVGRNFLPKIYPRASASVSAYPNECTISPYLLWVVFGFGFMISVAALERQTT